MVAAMIICSTLNSCITSHPKLTAVEQFYYGYRFCASGVWTGHGRASWPQLHNVRDLSWGDLNSWGWCKQLETELTWRVFYSPSWPLDWVGLVTTVSPVAPPGGLSFSQGDSWASTRSVWREFSEAGGWPALRTERHFLNTAPIIAVTSVLRVTGGDRDPTSWGEKHQRTGNRFKTIIIIILWTCFFHTNKERKCFQIPQELSDYFLKEVIRCPGQEH